MIRSLSDDDDLALAYSALYKAFASSVSVEQMGIWFA